MNKRYDARLVTEGAMTVAIFVLLTLISHYTPIGAITLFALSAPSAVLTYRHGARLGIFSSIAGALLLSIIIGPVAALTTALSFQMTGIVIGWGVRQKHSAAMILLAGTAVGLVAIVAQGLLLFWVMGINMIEDSLESQLAGMELSRELIGRFNPTPEYLEALDAMPAMVEYMLTNLLPALLLSSALMLALINYTVIKVVLKKLGAEPPNLPPFSEWRIPQYFLWGLLASSLGLFIAGNSQTLQMLFYNIYLAFGILYGVQGIAIAYYFLGRWKVPKPLRFLFIFIFLNNFAFILFLPLFGIMDYTFDFRKLKEQP